MFLVERYWPGIDEPGARAVVASLEATARAMSAEGSVVEHVAFSLITATDEAAVRALNARADVPLDRIAAAIGIGIGDTDSPMKGDR